MRSFTAPNFAFFSKKRAKSKKDFKSVGVPLVGQKFRDYTSTYQYKITKSCHELFSPIVHTKYAAYRNDLAHFIATN